jgi:nucleotide-binding universal stress UspA family protein
MLQSALDRADVEGLEARIRTELEGSLRSAIAARSGGVVPIEAHLLRGHRVAAMLMDEAESLDVDVLVVGTSGQGGMSRLLLGSVAERVVRHCLRDVLVVPERSGSETARAVTSIVCALDFSPASELALGRALTIARAHRASVHALYVCEPNAYAPHVPGLHEEQQESAKRTLDEALRRHDTAGLEVSRDVRIGSPAIEIVRYAAGIGADLVVMATTGKSGVDHVLLGSVAERVVRSSPVPVWVSRTRVRRSSEP